MRWPWRDRGGAREPAIVAFGSDRGFLGVGVFNGKGRVLTCAHVVAAALGVPRNTDLTDKSVSVWFPFLRDEAPIAALVRRWISPDDGDFAGLELSRTPRRARPGRLLELSPSLEGREASAFGYPNDFAKDGIWASVVIKRNQANGLTQVEGGSAASQYKIEPGFSGSPVWLKPDQPSNGTRAWLTRDDIVMGIVRQDDAATSAAFAIPAEALERWWPGCSTFRVSDRRWPEYLRHVAKGAAITLGAVLALYVAAKIGRAVEAGKIDTHVNAIGARDTKRPEHLRALSDFNPVFALESHAIAGLASVVRQENARGPTCARRDSTAPAVRSLDSLVGAIRALQKTATDRLFLARYLDGFLAFASSDSIAPVDVDSLARTDLSGARLDSLHLTRADLQGACLLGTKFNGAVLDSANLSGGTLDDASFLGAFARGASFRDASLRGTDLSRSKLQRADFVGANLSCALLGNADVSDAEFEFAIAAWAYFGNTTLTRASNWRSIDRLANANFELPVDAAAPEIEIAKSKGAVMTTSPETYQAWIEAKNVQRKPGGVCAS